tara:strand:+ start:271 stop:432 length:162 start_codon:yes stop_codon:yes gene_type:complete
LQNITAVCAATIIRRIADGLPLDTAVAWSFLVPSLTMDLVALMAVVAIVFSVW